MRKPLLLDLFCGAGGASMGYHQAGFEIVGVDIKPQPRYPFEFIQADAFEVFAVMGGRFDLIHASPPCQRYSVMTERWGTQENHSDYIVDLREVLFETPYVIENVVGSPLENPTILCGEMFDLHSDIYRLRRHRLFETSFPLIAPQHPAHTGKALGVYGNTGGKSTRDGLTFAKVSDWRIGMGIDWMTAAELKEAIPPAYTKYIGLQIRKELI